MKILPLLLLTLPLCATAQDVFNAIRNNDLSALKKADVTVRDRRGNTPLIYAAGFGSVAAVRMLLEAGSDVDARNAFDATPLIWAAGNLEKLRLLIDRGANVNVKTKQGRTPLMVAAACDGCSASVRLLLEKGADPRAQDIGNDTALMLAAESGDTESLRLLLAAGGDAKSGNKSGLTPLHRAAFNCNLESARLLLSHGADANARNTFSGRVKFGDIQLVGLTPLGIAAPFCRTELIDVLIEAGADVNAKDIRGMTPLMLAVASETQDAAIVRRLVHAGAGVNAKSATGESPLDWAKKFGDRDAISILTAEGAHEAAKPTVAAHREADPRAPRAAVETAVRLLEGSATEFFRQSGCVGCHHQPLAVMASAAARMDGAADLVKMISTQFASSEDNLMQRFDPGGGADGEGYSLLALHATGYAPDSVTDTIAVHTAAMQRRAGNWHTGDAPRAPLQESDIARTARAMRSLQLYAPPALRPEFEQRIARARDFILEAHARTNDDFAMQLAAAHWAGAPQARVQALGRALAAMQREDGGWSQNPNLTSDSYATGETLWALHETGILKPADAAYQRGVKFLLSTQRADGSWFVRSRAPKFQPYFESGFPYGHDQWISSAATAWAVMALAPAMEKEKK